MKTSFAKAPAAPAPTTETKSSSALAVAETPNDTLAFQTQGVDGQVNGEFSARDLAIPRMNLVAKSGELSNVFPPGSFVYNREVIIGDGKVPCEITILRMNKFYLQDLVYGSGEMPKSFSSLRDVRAAGGVLAYDPTAEEGSDKYSEALTCIVLVKSPAKEHPLFPFEQAGSSYGLAQWLLTKSAYRQTAKKLFTDSQMALKAGIDTATYGLTSEIKTNSAGSWYVPTVKMGKKHDAPFIEFVRGLVK